ncbi:MAG: ribosomal-protein-alanine N-acetyltransferase [Elusimicrobia bacterium HGW-Elusimicrobia-1]|jgi:ribosomal-protein-alanine N-acetyltransferase|nr:MAG: ribosomal-protein-alanine N-acetyltransferase [Elusimicrobia bacterium HGW-Elusimicrobia-1]
MTLKFEKLKSSDAAEIYEIEKISFSEPHSLASVAAAIMNPACEFWVLRDAPDDTGADGAKTEKIAGFIEFWLMYDEAHVIDIAVRPEYRRRGLGRRLMDFLVEKSAEAGAKKIFLEVRPSNSGAISLYKEAGFVDAGRRVKYYKDEDALIMTRDVEVVSA